MSRNYDDGIKVDLLFPTFESKESLFKSIWNVWHNSKVGIGECIPEYNYVGVSKLIESLLNVDIPVLEMFPITILLKNVPVFFREQMVRHKIMCKFGENYGVDTIPNLSDSTWWSQSMRIQNMGEFYNENMYYTPEDIYYNRFAFNIYEDILSKIQYAYNELVSLGIPLEMARGILPFASNHNITWHLNLSILMKIIGIRTCWILQTGIWSSVIGKIVAELSKFDVAFKNIALPSCFESGKFTTCKFKIENVRRLHNSDRLPTCPLYVFNDLNKDESINVLIDKKSLSEIDKNDYSKISEFIIDIMNKINPRLVMNNDHFISDFIRRSNIYTTLWNRNIVDGGSNE